MTKIKACLILFLLIITYLGIGQTLPKSPIKGWTVNDSVTVYSGDDLYFLIDGGAEVYIEYGFSKVYSADYHHADTKIHAELYEMIDNDAAWGIFSLRKPGAVTQIGHINLASWGLDYLMAGKERFYLLLSGSDDKILLSEMAQGILHDLPDGTNSPGLIAQLDTTGKQIDSEVYFKGTIALSNIFQFGYTMLGNFANGVSANYNNNVINVLLKFETAKLAEEEYKNFTTKALSNERYKLVTQTGDEYLFENKQQDKIAIHKPDADLLNIIVFRHLN